MDVCIVFTDMAREAGTAALKDAGILYQDVEAVVASYCYGEPTSGKVQVAAKFWMIFDSFLSLYTSVKPPQYGQQRDRHLGSSEVSHHY